jgi:hypothetical protein
LRIGVVLDCGLIACHPCSWETYHSRRQTLSPAEDMPPPSLFKPQSHVPCRCAQLAQYSGHRCEPKPEGSQVTGIDVVKDASSAYRYRAWRVYSTVVCDRVQPTRQVNSSPKSSRRLASPLGNYEDNVTSCAGQRSAFDDSKPPHSHNRYISRYQYPQPYQDHVISLAHEGHSHSGRYCRIRAAKSRQRCNEVTTAIR